MKRYFDMAPSKKILFKHFILDKIAQQENLHVNYLSKVALSDLPNDFDIYIKVETVPLINEKTSIMNNNVIPKT